MKNHKTATIISLIIVAVIAVQLMQLTSAFVSFAPNVTAAEVQATYMDTILTYSCVTVFLQLVIFLLLKVSFIKKDVS